MHVVGARFTNLDAAIAALRAIRAAVAIEPPDVGVRPLGTTRYDQPIEAYLLAGRFDAEDVQAVATILADHGGLVISQRPEWPARHPPAAPAPATSSAPAAPEAPDPSRAPATRQTLAPEPARSPRIPRNAERAPRGRDARRADSMRSVSRR